MKELFTHCHTQWVLDKVKSIFYTFPREQNHYSSQRRIQECIGLRTRVLRRQHLPSALNITIINNNDNDNLYSTSILKVQALNKSNKIVKL